jgi:hypothetical protein
MRRGVPIWRLSGRLGRLIPTGRLPITEGRIHFLRKVDPSGKLEVLNESWSLGDSWSGEYVRATINTGEQVIGFWHQAALGSDWRLIKTARFRLEETVHELVPDFRRNRARCRDCLPG